MLRSTLEQQGFVDIQIEDLSKQVLLGFSQYIQNQQGQKQSRGLANFKIQMTAKLCQQLYQNGYVRYIQITAIKNRMSYVSQISRIVFMWSCELPK